MNTNTNEMVAKHSGDDGTGGLGYAMVEAIEGKDEVEKEGESDNVQPIVSASDLPDLSQSDDSLSEEDLQKATEEAQKKKSWVENAGVLLRSLKDEREEIRVIEGWDLVQELVDKEATLTFRINEIESAGDENLHRHLEFSEFLNSIRDVETPEQMDGVVKYLISEQVNDNGETRYRFVSKDEARRLKSTGAFPRFGFYWGNCCYLPYEPADGERKSPGQIAVEKEVMKAVRCLSMLRKKEISRKTEELRLVDASEDLTGILDGVCGYYRIVQGAILDRKNKKRIIKHGGVLIVRLIGSGRGSVIETVDGVGLFDWASSNGRVHFCTVSEAIFAKVSDDVPGVARDKIFKLACPLNKHLFPIWLDRKRSKKSSCS